jgi:predicted flap endonuclease-1-like 5' DNA nuclease
MIALAWQTLLVLMLAYFAGCIIGCLARKMIGASARSGREPMDGGLAFASGGGGVSPSSLETFVPPRPPVRPARDAFRRANGDTPSDATPPPSVAQPPVAATPPTSQLSPAPIVAPPVSAVAAVAAAAPDDLTRIRAIDRALESKLHAAGVMRYGEIATWTSEQVKAISEMLGFDGRIERENWIEQAHILARGGVTQYATTIARVAPAPIAVSPPDVATRAAFAEPRGEAPVVPAAAVPSASGRENLQRIGGISAEIESVLNAHGVTRYSQVAGWGSADIGRLEGLLGFSGRISRENWIEQAQILANGGATAYSREVDRAAGVDTVPPQAAPAAPIAMVAPEAPTPPPVAVVITDPPATGSAVAERSQILAGMRSVRSEAYRGDDSLSAPPSARVPDDLKRIRGIGVLLERRLNAMGVTTYEQIANWTAEDVGTVNTKLEFQGRIERENWIEQARILASGGHTDFSRRFERGEV